MSLRNMMPVGALLLLVSTSELLLGCSIVLAPSRRQTDAGPLDTSVLDAAALDVPRLDTPGLDAPELDAPGTDSPLVDVPGLDTGLPVDGGVDAPVPDVPMPPDVPGPLCPLDYSCLPAAPAGWMGPVVLTTGSGAGSAPACPSTAPSQAFTAQSGISAAAASCGCSCTPPTTGLSCGSATLISTNSACTAGSTNIAMIANGACVAVTMPTSGAWTLSRPAFSASGSSCTAVPSTTVPPLAFGASHRACSVAAPTACGTGRACAPTPSAANQVCVYADGDVSCPSSFPVQIATSEGATDTRGCSACSCGTVTGTCGGYVTLENGCSGSVYYGDVAVGGCTPAMSVPGSRATATYTPTASCPPTAPSPTGSATPRMPRTVCCLP